MAIVISGVNNNDKITASDGTIDLLSSANLSGILTAPAFSATGNITAGHINIGPGISLGQSGVATATTFVGNLTGNVNATSNLLLQIGGSEKFRVGSSGQLGIGGANYGTSGQVLTSGGSGSAATWSTITGTTINNNGTSKIITGSGTPNTLNANVHLTFDGTTLDVKSGTGIVNAGQLTTSGTTFVNKHSVGVGTTTTAGRNAGVSTAIGTVNFNTTTSKLEYYDGNKWFQITDNRFSASGGTQSTFGNYTLFTFTSSGTFTVQGSGNIDVLVVGGGGAGGLPSGNSNFGGGGGAGGLVWVTGYNVAAGQYSIVVGNGGAKGAAASTRGNSGQDSTAFGLTAKGGGGGGSQGGTSTGASGGSGGGAGYTGGNSGGASATQPSQSNTGVGTLVYNLGNSGANGNTNPNGGGGGGGAGGSGFTGSASCNGGAGFNMSALLGTGVGDSGWFAGGGGGTQQAGHGTHAGNNGGLGGGGDSTEYNDGSSSPTAGQANTGGGGGAGRNGGFGATDSGDGEAGGSGVVIIRVLTSLL